MALELECNLVRKLEPVSGTSARGPWSKQEFIVQYQDGNFPNQVVLNVWGEDKVRDLGQYQPGDRIKASLTPSSREFNGRWYTDIRAWKIERVLAPAAGTAPAAPAAPAIAAPANTVAPTAPAAPAAPVAPAAPDAIDLSEGSEEDLPF